MNSLSSSCSHHSSHTSSLRHTHAPHHHRSYLENTLGQTTFFSPLVTWIVFLGIVFSLVLIFLFCTQPLTPANLSSDFHAGVEGVRELFHHNSIQSVKKNPPKRYS